MFVSPDLTITKSINEILIEIDGKIEVVRNEVKEVRADMKALDEKLTGQMQELKTETRTQFDALEARLTSKMDMRVNTLSSYIQWSMSFIGIIAVAAPILSSISTALTQYLSRRADTPRHRESEES